MRVPMYPTERNRNATQVTPATQKRHFCFCVKLFRTCQRQSQVFPFSPVNNIVIFTVLSILSTTENGPKTEDAHRERKSHEERCSSRQRT